MNESCSPVCPFRLTLKSLAELALVTAGTLALIYGLEQLAEYRANRPIAADAQGTAILPVPQATLRGSLRLTPWVLEEQKSDFPYSFGPKLAAERASRTISHWVDLDSSVAWRFQTPLAGVFEIEIQCAADPQEAGGEFEVSVGPERLTAAVPSTGGSDTWQVKSVGQLRIAEPGVYTLAIKPIKLMGKKLMDLKQVVVRRISG